MTKADSSVFGEQDSIFMKSIEQQKSPSCLTIQASQQANVGSTKPVIPVIESDGRVLVMRDRHVGRELPKPVYKLNLRHNQIPEHEKPNTYVSSNLQKFLGPESRQVKKLFKRVETMDYIPTEKEFEESVYKELSMMRVLKSHRSLSLTHLKQPEQHKSIFTQAMLSKLKNHDERLLLKTVCNKTSDVPEFQPPKLQKGLQKLRQPVPRNTSIFDQNRKLPTLDQTLSTIKLKLEAKPIERPAYSTKSPKESSGFEPKFPIKKQLQRPQKPKVQTVYQT